MNNTSPIEAAVTAWYSGGDYMFDFCIEAAHIVGRRVEGETKELGRRIRRSEDTVERHAKAGLLWWAMLAEYPSDSESLRDALDYQYWLALAPMWSKNLMTLDGAKVWLETAVNRKWDYDYFLTQIPKKRGIDSEWQKTARRAADILDELVQSPAFGVDEKKFHVAIKLLKYTSIFLRGMTVSNIVEKLIEEKIASNPFQAAHIANGLELAKMKDDTERLIRARLYRDWRNAGEPSKVAYSKAIKGEEVPAEMFEVDPDTEMEIAIDNGILDFEDM